MIDYQLIPIHAVEAEIGRRLEALRLGANVTQAQLAEQAGVSRRTITRLENGGGVSLDTLIRVMRALGLENRLEALLPDAAVQPIDRVRSQGKRRQRARPPRTPSVSASPSASAWTWADDTDDTADDTDADTDADAGAGAGADAGAGAGAGADADAGAGADADADAADNPNDADTGDLGKGPGTP
jgi:transcriptional regulator with XRE-family HTH domain